MANEERRLELTSKLIKMGSTLGQEGAESDDITISQVGTMLIFLGGLLFSEDDVNKFSELVSMFSAKKLIENMEENNHDFNKFMDFQANRNTYDDIINKIDGLRSGFDDDEDDEDDEELNN